MITFAPESIISNRADNAQSVFAIDMDGDGDLDVLSASSSDNKVAWYENDGNQNFTPKIISTTAEKVDSVFAVDVDQDGDTDVISTLFKMGQYQIVLYENDGNQNFSEQIIFSGIEHTLTPPYILVTDIDSDSDPDIISSWDDVGINDKIVGYENDGQGNFSQFNIFTVNDYPENILPLFFAADINSDTDTDLLSVVSTSDYSSSDDYWYHSYYYGYYETNHRIIGLENDGNQNFSEQTLLDALGYENISSLFATDLDGDNDTDILVSQDYTNKITWYDNNGNQNYSERTIFTTIGADSIFGVDLDNDGDSDVLSSYNEYSYYPSSIGKIGIYENDGDVNFTESILSTNAHSITSTFLTDIDGDGDIDILCSSADDDKISWYENLTINGVDSEDATENLDSNSEDVTDSQNNSLGENFIENPDSNSEDETDNPNNSSGNVTENPDSNSDEGVTDNSNTVETTDNLLIGTTDNEYLEGSDNRDILLGLKGNDNLNGDSNNDLLFGGQHDDTILGGQGNDFLNGNLGDDQLFGHTNNDTLIGEEGEDILQGGQGEYLLDGGLGNDFLFGGLGRDQFVLRSGEGTDTILDYLDGTDSFLLDGLTFNELTISSGIGQVIISSGEEILALVMGVDATALTSEDFITL